MNTQSGSFLTNLRRLSLVEGTSTLVLFGIAMPLKYMAGMPTAVRIVGSAHGVLFVALSVMLFMAVNRISLPFREAIMGIVMAVVPFGPFFFDRRLASFASKSSSER